MDTKMLTNMKAAESLLAKEHSRRTAEDVSRVVRGLPGDHPLVNEVNQKMATGDLAGLPAGHPLWKMLEDAKARYEAKGRETEAREQREPSSPVKRKDESEADRDRQRREEEEEEAARQARQMAGKTINDQIGRLIGEMERLYLSMGEMEPMFESNPYSSVKLKKLRRLLIASRRGVEECKISVTRV